MKYKFLTSEATVRERFAGVFILSLAVFSIGFALVFTFSSPPSNIVWNGEEIRGWRLLVANCFLIPAGSALLAALAAGEHYLSQKIASLWRSRREP